MSVRRCVWPFLCRPLPSQIKALLQSTEHSENDSWLRHLRAIYSVEPLLGSCPGSPLPVQVCLTLSVGSVVCFVTSDCWAGIRIG